MSHYQLEVAYLGPAGTYSHQAAHDIFGDAALYRPRDTIAELLSALDSVPLALLPWENSMHGVVHDTLDLLRSPDVGTRLRVRGARVVAVKHCLLVKKGVQLAQVKRVMSHEQALGQCAAFLKAQLPHAALVRTASTALAAQMVAAGETDESAAICSSICATLYPGIEIAREGIQDADDNETRFILLSSGDVPLPPSITFTVRRALIRASIPDDSGPSVLGPLLTTLVSVPPPLGICRVDRRSALTATPFHDVYFVELMAPLGAGFKEAVEDLVKRAQSIISAEGEEGGEATLLGVW